MKITSAKQLSSYLKDRRLTESLSQAKVASKIGIRQDTVSSFELQPETTRLDTLFRILAALDLEMEIKPRGLASAKQDPDGWKEEW